MNNDFLMCSRWRKALLQVVPQVVLQVVNVCAIDNAAGRMSAALMHAYSVFCMHVTIQGLAPHGLASQVFGHNSRCKLHLCSALDVSSTRSNRLIQRQFPQLDTIPAVLYICKPHRTNCIMLYCQHHAGNCLCLAFSTLDIMQQP